MGLLDFLQSDNHKREAVIIELGIKAGLFTRCPICHDVTEPRHPEQHADVLNQVISEYMRSNAQSLGLFQHDVKILKDNFTQTISKLPYYCHCHDN